MLKLLNQIVENITAFFRRFPPERRAMIILVFLIVIGASVGLLVWAFKPQYRVLYSDLSLKDSGEIVDVLTEEKIPYRIEREGQRILVPSDKVYQTRLKLASRELPKEKGTGWELFDKTSLGVTDFVQKLNFRRGLEGELARTILQLDPIEAVRVHVVMPEESLFRETRKEPMASVSLRLKGGYRLSAAQVEGITYMVSSAVEGLRVGNVTVIDSKGYVLSERRETDPIMRLTATQLDLQNKVEARLIAKGQELLDKRFGIGRSAIQVTARLDFKSQEVTQEIYDADNPAIRSEEITSTSSMGSDTSSSNSENSITNYELNLTRDRRSKPVGEIARMTIAVMVDGVYNEKIDPKTGDSMREFVPLEDKELDGIGSTIKMALGFDSGRGDEIKVVSVPFQDMGMLDKEVMVTMDRWDLLNKYGQKVVTLIAIGLLLLMVRNFFRKAEVAAAKRFGVRPAQLEPGFEEEPEALPEPSALELRLSRVAREDAMLKEQVTAYTKEKPEMAAKLIRSWLLE